MEQVFDVEQAFNMEQAQRGGTGPKKWNRPKDQPYLSAGMGQAQRGGTTTGRGGGGREKEEAGHVATLPRREVVTIRACPGAGSSGGTLARRRVVHEATTLQRCHAAQWSPLPATPRRGVDVSQATPHQIKFDSIRFEIQIKFKFNPLKERNRKDRFCVLK